MTSLPPGFVLDEQKSAPALPPGFVVDEPSMAEDVAKSAGIGLAKGTIGIAGGGGDVRSLLSKATDYLGEKAGVSPDTLETVKNVASRVTKATPARVIAEGPTSADIQGKIEEQTGEFYKPQTRAGKYTERATEFIPASLIGAGGLPRKILTGVTSGLGSEAAGQYYEGTKAEPYARIVGALGGGLAPSAVGRAVTPLPTSAARQRLVDVLADEGVTSLTAGQRTGNRPLKYAEDMLGNAPGAGQSAANIAERGQQQFTQAAMRRAGQGLEDAAPEALQRNSQRLGNEFERLSAANNLTPDNQFITDLTAAARNYRNVPNSQQRAMVQGYIDDIVEHVNNGQMPGPQYQEMRSRLSRQANSLRDSDPTLSEALRDMRNALDNAMGRSISPADREAWQAARREYGAQRTIEKTASRAGEATAEGQLVPANLRNTVSAENRGAYARGQGPFSELARAGAGVMAPLPNSGTAQRLNLTNVAMLPITATIGRALMSRPVQAYLGNQLMTRQLENAPSVREMIARALLQNRTQALEGPSSEHRRQ
jgi:hypothetical protein